MRRGGYPSPKDVPGTHRPSVEPGAFDPPSRLVIIGHDWTLALLSFPEGERVWWVPYPHPGHCGTGGTPALHDPRVLIPGAPRSTGGWSADCSWMARRADVYPGSQPPIAGDGFDQDGKGSYA